MKEAKAGGREATLEEAKAAGRESLAVANQYSPAGGAQRGWWFVGAAGGGVGWRRRAARATVIIVTLPMVIGLGYLAIRMVVEIVSDSVG